MVFHVCALLHLLLSCSSRPLASSTLTLILSVFCCLLRTLSYTPSTYCKCYPCLRVHRMYSILLGLETLPLPYPIPIYICVQVFYMGFFAFCFHVFIQNSFFLLSSQNSSCPFQVGTSRPPSTSLPQTLFLWQVFFLWFRMIALTFEHLWHLSGENWG